MSNTIKILATVGPASIEKSVLERMDLAGVDVFRINLSHTKAADFLPVLKKIRQGTLKIVCVDSEGAQVRTGKMAGGNAAVKKNSVVELVSFTVLGSKKKIPLYPIEPWRLLKVGDVLYLDFNNAIIQVISVEGKNVSARVLEGGFVGSNKGVTVDRDVELPAFTKKDLQIFKKAVRQKISHVALSFASKKEDVAALRKLFGYPIFVISKIESKKGLAHLEEICRASDAILIDRGDLSRDVQLSKIGLAQKYILETAQKIGTPVYVATNLLETMIESSKPTRAEINDITNTLLMGASGLVLAAETAIGKNPVESVRMIASIMGEVKKYEQEKSGYIDSIYKHNLIEPHGGVLVQNIIDKSQVKNINQLPKIKVTEQMLLDVVQIAEGVYSPLRGFMNYKELTSVLDNYKMPSGVVWTLPILLQLNKEDINFKKGNTVAFVGQDKIIYGIIRVSEIKKINLEEIAKKWFGTTDENHPGVANFRKKGDYIIAGEVFLLQKSSEYAKFHNLSPKQTREIFENFGWQKVVGFHTRNVIHRGHEHIQKEALKRAGADALFISPVVGPKKKNDFKPNAIIGAYELMIKNNHYAPYPAIIGSFATYSRYSGPREAVFTALCRKNFGCTHFVIGRDHTGVGNYYAPNASQEIFAKVGDIGIQPLMFDEAYHCNLCGGTTTNCNHAEKERVKISGTKARTALLAGEEIPEHTMRPEISAMLVKMHQNPKEKLFE